MMQIKWFKHTQVIFSSLILILSLFTSISSYAKDLEIEKATYKSEDQRLNVILKRKGNLSRTSIKVYDDDLNQLIAEKQSSKDEVKFKVKSITGEQVPCSVRVELDGTSATRRVKNAPSDCSQSALVEDEVEVEFEIEKATYKSEDQRLNVVLKREGNLSRTSIKVYDDDLNQLIAEKQSSKDEVKFKVKSITGEQVPCSVRVELDGTSATRRVKNAPLDCSQSALVEVEVEFEIEKATYKSEDQRLNVVLKREGNLSRTSIKVYDDDLKQLIAEKQSSKDKVKFRIRSIIGEQVPCSVRVEIAGHSVTREVKNTPPDCSQNTNDSNPGPDENTPPSCSIVTPAGNVAIILGAAIEFSGLGTDPDEPLSYTWDFGGGADIRPMVAEPGDVVFDQNNGIFNVNFTVIDSLGARCTDTITVQVGDIPTGVPGKVSEVPISGSPGAGDGQHVVVAYNDLGMHCGDLRSFPFSVLPPFNTVHGQLIRKGSIGTNKPVILGSTGYQLLYSAASNPNDPVGSGSINSTSQNYPPGSNVGSAIVKKNDLWDQLDADDTIVSALFGFDVAPDTGLTGSTMPGISTPYYANIPQLFNGYDDQKRWFTALGIPMVGIDDTGRLNSYPLMRVQGSETISGITLATLDVVLPVSSEVDCRDCHTKGKIAAVQTARTSLNAPQFIEPVSLDRADVEQAAKENIIILHNYKHATHLLEDGKPVLCASCHGSNALGTVGLPNVGNMSNVMHGQHGRFQLDGDNQLMRDAVGEPVLIDPENLTGAEKPLIAFGPEIPMEENCFLCHPGKITQCFRGAMFSAGQKCEDCHGNMLAVGGEYPLNNGQARNPWADEPRCGSCHTGHGDEPVLTKAFAENDLAANPLPAVRPRFSENSGTLYRDSIGHGGVGCEGCHGSPHAIWPNQNPNANDNVAAIQLQGHKGSVQECTVCHEQNSFPEGTLSGPHGMHPVNDPNWIKSKDDLWHEDYVKDAQGNDQCAACHGADHRGTRLSKVPVDRVLRDADGVVRATLSAGDIVSCDLCHSLKKSFDD